MGLPHLEIDALKDPVITASVIAAPPFPESVGAKERLKFSQNRIESLGVLGFFHCRWL